MSSSKEFLAMQNYMAEIDGKPKVEVDAMKPIRRSALDVDANLAIEELNSAAAFLDSFGIEWHCDWRSGSNLADEWEVAGPSAYRFKSHGAGIIEVRLDEDGKVSSVEFTR